MISQAKTHFLVFLATFFLLLFVVNVKTFLFPFIFAFVIFFFYLGDSLIESTFLTLLISLPFENSIRQWLIYYSIHDPANGYSLYFGITVKIIFALLLLLLYLIPKNRILLKQNSSTKNSLILLLFFILTTVTSIFFQSRTSTVFLGYIRLTSALLFYYSATIYFSNPSKKNIFYYFIISLTIFSSTIGLIQLIKQSPTGRYIELTPSFAKSTGYITTDGIAQYRVSGFISHPVYFGSFLSILIPIVIGLFFEKKQFRYLPIIIISILVLLGTLSRSTWINLAIIILLFYYYSQKNHLIPSFKFSKVITRFIFPLTIFILLLLIIPPIITRIKSIPDLINNQEGSAFTRINLAKTSLKITSIHPLFGIGLNSFSFENYSAPPHNTFLIFLVELGIPTTLIFLTFIYLSLKPQRPVFKKEIINFGVWVGLLTFVISSQFHPLFNLDPTFDMFMLTLGYYSTTNA